MDKEERMAYLLERRKDVDRLLMAFQLREGGPEDLQAEDRALAEVMAEQGMIHLHQRYTIENPYIIHGRWEMENNRLKAYPERVIDFIDPRSRVKDSLDSPDESGGVAEKPGKRSAEKELTQFTETVKDITVCISTPLLIFGGGLLIFLLLLLIFK